MICRNCHAEIPEKSSICPVCGYEIILSEKTLNAFKKVENTETAISKIMEIHKVIIATICIMISIIFITIGAIPTISQIKAARGYEKTIGDLINYKKETINESEYYVGVYEYNVNGQTYKVETNNLTSKDKIKRQETIRYNPEDPKESTIYADTYIFIIIGLLIDLVAVFELKGLIQITAQQEAD